MTRPTKKIEKPEYSVMLLFETEQAAKRFAISVMGPRPPKGTKAAYRVVEAYPKAETVITR